MPSILTQKFLCLLLLAVAYWPIVPWYYQRFVPPEEKFCGILALLTATGFLLFDRRAVATRPLSLLLPTVLTSVYIIGNPFLPELAVAMVAMMAIAATLSTVVFGVPFNAGLAGLLLLALPIVSRAQFYLGYPLRLMVGVIAAPLIRLSGLPVTREGAVLNHGGDLVIIDAPCSGVQMLWTGMYLAFTLACIYQLNIARTAAAAGVVLAVVVAGNALRTASLFQLESLDLDYPAWAHDAVGGIVFLFTSLLVVASVRVLIGKPSCAS